MKKNKFRLQTKDIFLTYSKCPLGKDKIHNYIKELMISKKQEISYIISNTENHQDHKEIHTHVLFQLTKQLSIRNQRFFDIEGFHPKIENARDIEKSIDYIKKDGDFIEEGTPRHKKYVRQNQKEERKQLIYDEIMRLKDEYYNDDSLTLNKVRKSLDDFILNIDRDFYLEQSELIDRILNKKFTKKKEELEDEEEFFKPDYSFDSFKSNSKTNEIIAAIQTQLSVQSLGERPKSIVIEGFSRLGKTEFILSYLTHKNLHYNYTRGDFDFSKQSHKNAYKVNIFDDISIPQIRKEGLFKQIIGGQKGFKYNVKYAPKRTIAGKKLSIFLVNPDISFENYCEWSEDNGHKFHEYIKDNCIFIYVPDKLY
uniref:Replication associated protein n=1 Tax=Chinaberry witches'-broom phytoplasma TaxID=389343 RepID=F5CUH2_9MOLU|nr:replication-associated protein [Chinaberry witches'-broom phytoplasma]AEC45506.1 replication associated protein [Chinaberry witches'-broom phytoplasma]